MESAEEYDAIICGSGAGALLTAIRLHDLGLSSIVIEKSSRYGGTSAVSGGAIWIPGHRLGGNPSDREADLTYLNHVSQGSYRAEKLEAYLDNGPEMVDFLEALDVRFMAMPGMPDYFPEAPGASDGRSLFPIEMDGAELGGDFNKLREAHPCFKLFGRYALNLEEGFALSARARGWQFMAAKIFSKYWLDLGWRRRTSSDRRLTMGRALIGALRRAMQRRAIPLRLNCGLAQLIHENDRVIGIKTDARGIKGTLLARRAVVISTGGFEQNQKLRDEYLPVATQSDWSLTPRSMNVGDGLIAGMNIGADTEVLDANWWAPSTQLPSRSMENVIAAEPMFYDHRHPYSLCVNRRGERFVNESCTYDRFGKAMIADHLETGANLPCWLIFDAKFRQEYPCGPILPSFIMPDRKLPADWWDSYLFKAGSIPELARKIGIDADKLTATVGQMNAFAETGVDEEFGRGNYAYDRYFAKPNGSTNPCFGPIDRPPYYAIRLDLGDLGSKGGLKTDHLARVMDTNGTAIDGLYAIGNCSGSPFGNCYPGAGGTIGPAMVYGYIAANHIANTTQSIDQINIIRYREAMKDK